MSNRPNTAKHGRAAPRVAAAEDSQSRSILQSPVLWVGAITLLAAIVAIALSSGGDSAPTSDVEETAFAETIGDPLPLFASPNDAAGLAAPQLIAQTLDGDRAQIRPDDGVARVIVFLAHWCSHCQAELPRIVDWMAANEVPDGVEILAVSTSVDTTAANYPPSAWFEQEGFTGTILVDNDDSSLAQGYGLGGFPFGAAVGADGTVLTRWAGEISSDEFGAIVAQATATVGDSASEGAAPADAQSLVTVSADTAAELHSNPPDDLVVLDVRTQDEFDSGHLESATMLDFYREDFADRLAELDPDKPYLLYCKSGNRSGQALTLMRSLGFTDVTEIDGGFSAWVDAGLPTTT